MFRNLITLSFFVFVARQVISFIGEKMFEEVRERFARGETDSDQTERYGHPSIFGNCQGFLLLAKTVVRLF